MPRKTKKNAQGAGTIRKRPGGRLETRYTIGFDPATGKQKSMERRKKRFGSG